jgi:hypothetical protein
MDDDHLVIRRSLSFALVVVAVVLSLALPARAGVLGEGGHESTATTLRQLPRTEAEAEQRDDGNNLGAPWVLGSAVAAGAVILVGGLWMKRRMEREDA